MKNKLSKTVAKLKEIRTAQRISQVKFSAKLGMAAPSQLQDYEQGRNTPSITKIEEWAEALGYEISLIPINKVTEDKVEYVKKSE